MSHSNIIELWPSLDALSSDVGAKVETVRKWKQRGRIPARHWVAVADAAKGRKLGVSLDVLAREAGGGN